MLKEFKEFALKGNVLDMAVGVIVGAAFGKIVSSLTEDILMPVISLITGKIDFSNLFLTLNGPACATLQQAKAAGAVTWNYGLFINTVINFLIVAFAIFLLVRQVNKWRKPQEQPEAPKMKECPFCCTMVPEKAVKCHACTADLK